MTRSTSATSRSVASAFMTMSIVYPYLRKNPKDAEKLCKARAARGGARSHPLGHLDAEGVERCGELRAHEVRDVDEDGPPDRVPLFEDAVLVAIVEEVKCLCQLEGVLGEVRRLREVGRLSEHFGQTRRQRHQRPNLVSDLALENFL